jgi:hypothetical protein
MSALRNRRRNEGLVGGWVWAASFDTAVTLRGLPANRIIASSPELQERELIKAASLTAAMARALRARGFGDTAATLAAHTGTTIMHVTFEQWVNDPNETPFQQIARDALAQLREIASTG